ncbi:PDZ domain-containing protein [Aphelenchoides fujianensis]|nr:PDZ domain-containing protein [Aphelenchoides fujianensis]
MAASAKPTSPCPSGVSHAGPVAPPDLFQPLTVTLQGAKGAKCGFRVSSSLTVLHVERGSAADTKLQFADQLLELNGTPLDSKRAFLDLFKKTVAAGPRFKVELKIRRPGVETLPGCKYRLGVLHKISACSLSIHIKSFANKVYVTKVNEETLAAMALQVGDAILDVEGAPVTSVEEVRELVCSGLKERGYVTMVIESPEDPAMKAFVRTVLITEKTQEVDLPLPTDVLEICRAEVGRLKATSNWPPARSALRNEKKPARPASSHLSIKEQVEDIPIACDGNPNLLVKVPLAPASQYQPLNIFQSPADQKK